MKLFDFCDSGNGYKVRLALALLGTEYEYVETDILTGGSRTPEFLARNPNGRIPTLQLDDGTHLVESNAILYYLGEGTPLVPDDRLARSKVLSWMFFEQYSHEPYIATVRFWLRHQTDDADRARRVSERRAGGEAALEVMEQRLRVADYLVDQFSIADIALYAYTHVANEAGYDLAAYPAIEAWLSRVADRPGWITLDAVPDKNL